MIERQHLVILREVHRRGSLTAAAESLCLTQSALSHAIRKLEGQVGTELWHKDGRGLRFSEAGLYLLSVAQRLLPQLEHTEAVLRQMASGQRGTLCIGIECHPCYRWLLKVVEPYLKQWPNVDVDVKQEFQFGGLQALVGGEIDILVTPDPLHRPGLFFEPVFGYEQVLVVDHEHRLAGRTHVDPEDLVPETLIAYPVEIDRLDIYTSFLLPQGYRPKKHKVIENTDIMLQMVAAGRGVAALPYWLVEEYATALPLKSLRLGERGLPKQLFVGLREGASGAEYVESFLEIARRVA